MVDGLFGTIYESAGTIGFRGLNIFFDIAHMKALKQKYARFCLLVNMSILKWFNFIIWD